MKLFSKKTAGQKNTFMTINKSALKQVKGGKVVESLKKRKTAAN